MPLKVVCKKDPAHNRFTVSAHVVELWEVDENADFCEVIATIDTTHRPDASDSYTCAECDSDAEVKLVEA